MQVTARKFRDRLEPGIAGMGDLGHTWGQVLCYALATRIAVAVMVVPVLALLLQLILNSQQRGVLSDQEILFFILSPMGLLALIIVGGFAVGVAFIEQAGMMVIGYGAAEHRRVTWWAAFRCLASKLPVLLPLGSHLLVRALLLALPFLAAAGGVVWLLLGDHDINYYLAERPPEFIRAALWIGIILAVLAVLLVRKLMSWMFALPAVLFEGLSPAAAIRRSVEHTRGRRRGLFAWTAGWLAGRGLLSAIVTWLTGFVGQLLLPLFAASASLVAFAIGSIGLLTLLLNFMISLLAAALFAMLIVRLYRANCGPGELPGDLRAAAPALDSEAPWRIPNKRVLAAVAAAAALALLITIVVVSQMKIEDRAIVIAHRGASMAAPENTLAAVRQALEDETDQVEIDVQETADGEVVVFHDSDFMKTAGNPLKIWEAKKADLADFDIGSWFDEKFAAERVPTLEQVLQTCKGRAVVNIELKYYGHDVNLEQRVIDLVERNDMADEVVIMSLKYDAVAKVRALRPQWTVGLLSSISLGNTSAFDVDFHAVNSAKARRSFIRQAQSSGREVYVWTVNDPLAMSAMMSRGVDGIITDKPALARRVLEMRRDLNPIERLLLGIGSEVGLLGDPEEASDKTDA